MKDLSYCSVGPYGPGLLHVGTVQQTSSEVVVFFTNLATGFVHMVENDPAEHPEVVVELPADLSPDQVYEVSVYGIDATTGIASLSFQIFTYDPVAGTWTAGGTAHDAVHVRFVKLWNAGAVHTYTEQWLNS